jgi:hypothetical protein
MRRDGGVSKAEMLFVGTNRVRAEWKRPATSKVSGRTKT